MQNTTSTIQVAKLPWWKSKTLWLNVILIVLGIIQGAQAKEWIPAEYQILIAAILNGIVRFLTTQPIQGGQNSTAPIVGITTTTTTPVAPGETTTITIPQINTEIKS